jgi:hypothetical protein
VPQIIITGDANILFETGRCGEWYNIEYIYQCNKSINPTQLLEFQRIYTPYRARAGKGTPRVIGK